MKAEVLAPRPDRLWNVLRLRGRHHEDHVIGRLLQRLQQRVKRRIGDLVRFIEDPDLVLVPRRPVARRLAQLAHFIDATIGRRIDLHHVDRIAGPNLRAGIANSARLLRRSLWIAYRRPAVERLRQNPRNGRFPDSPVAGKNVAMRDPLLLQRVQERARDMLLPRHIGKFLRTIFSSQNLVSHRMLIVSPERRLDFPDPRTQQLSGSKLGSD
jgi:hypothetical protein